MAQGFVRRQCDYNSRRIERVDRISRQAQHFPRRGNCIPMSRLGWPACGSLENLRREIVIARGPLRAERKSANAQRRSVSDNATRAPATRYASLPKFFVAGTLEWKESDDRRAAGIVRGKIYQHSSIRPAQWVYGSTLNVVTKRKRGDSPAGLPSHGTALNQAHAFRCRGGCG
jgi:hypothetical protein